MPIPTRAARRLVLLLLVLLLTGCLPSAPEYVAQQTRLAELAAGQLTAQQGWSVEQTRAAGLEEALTQSAQTAEQLRTEQAGQVAVQATRAAEYAAQIEDLTGQRDLAATNYRDLLERTRCPTGRAAALDLSEHAAVSRGLKTLIADYEDADPTANWEMLPGRVDSAIHRIYGREAWVFVVSLAAQDAERGTSVFWVEEQCFLDLP